jgi:diacylglycerol kinase (ATP)
MAAALLVNPHSGGGLGQQEHVLMEQILVREQAVAGGRLVITQSAEEAANFVATAGQRGVTRVIVGGGDDSVRDLLPTLLASGCELGVVPRGTFNNLARALGISNQLEEALTLALRGRARPIDLGTVAGHLFTESAGVGYLAEAWSRAPQPEPSGFLRWATGFMAAGSALLDYQPLNLKVSLDGRESEHDVWDLTVANCPLFANNIAIAPQARLDDGWLDVTLWPAMSRLEFLSALPEAVTGNPEQVPGVRMEQARVVEVRSPVEIPLRVDNTVLRGREFRFEVMPGALRVVCPEG